MGSVNCGSTVLSGHGGGGGSRTLRSSAKRNIGPLWQGPSSLKALYEILLKPMEDDLPEGFPCELVLVLEGDLLLVPFAMLKGTLSSACPEYLCERFSLLVAPSLTAIKSAKAKSKMSASAADDQKPAKSLIVGNPKLPSGMVTFAIFYFFALSRRKYHEFAWRASGRLQARHRLVSKSEFPRNKDNSAAVIPHNLTFEDMASCEKKQREMKLVTTLGDLSQV